MSDIKKDASKESSSASATNPPTKNLFPSIPVDCTTASKGVWLVKVPKYLASKWNSAPDNVEVGRIRITSTQYAFFKTKKIVFYRIKIAF